ncbi:MAG: PAS domain S-box protein [Brevinematales bacterium]|nr:PAS domain S-box protein [Brevinematales bacterium]
MARIYIVEDEAAVRLFLESFLKKHHEVVGSSGNFDEAYQEILEKQPDLVVSDIILLNKQGDGITLAEKVNQKSWIPFVFMTAIPFPKEDKRFFSIPVYGYIPKPIDEQRLISAVEMALWRIHAEKQLEVFTLRLQKEIEKKKELEQELRHTLHHHERFLEQLSDVVFDMDGEGRILFVNKAVEVFLGYTPEEVQGKFILDFVSEDFLFFSRELLHLFQEDIIAQKIFEERVYEISFRHKAGGVRWGRVNIVPLLTTSEILIGGRGIVYDITREKRQQERLETQLKRLQQEKHYQVIVRYVLERINQTVDPFPLFPRLIEFLRSSLNIDGILLFRKTQEGDKSFFKRLFCACYETRPCQRFLRVDIDDRTEFKRIIYWWKRSQVPQPFVSYWDEERIQKAVICPLLFEEKLFGALVCFWQTSFHLERSFLTILQILAHIFAQAIRRHDEWEQYTLAQKEALEQRLLLEKAQDMVSFGQMMSAIAHEVRQPLQSIRILSESPLYWYKEGKAIPYEKLLQNMEKITQRVQRIDGIIQGMRQAALAVATVKPEPVRLHEVIDEVLDTLQQEIVQETITLQKSLSPVDIVVRFHTAQLVQVISNIVVNAIRVLKNQPLPRVIRLETERINDKAILRVRDNGPGIPKEKEKYIFEPFFTTQPGVGMGIGLYVVKRLLSLYDATIAYRREGEETVFEMVFPYEEKNSFGNG